MKECYLIKIPFNTHGELYSKKNSLKIAGYANYIYDIIGKKTINEYLQLEKANYKVVDNNWTNKPYIKEFREFFSSDLPLFNNSKKMYIDLSENQINQINKHFKEKCKYTIGTQFGFFQGSAIKGEKTALSSLIHTHLGNQYNFNYSFKKIRAKPKEKINYEIVKEMGLFDFINYDKNFREIFEGNNYKFGTRKIGVFDKEKVLEKVLEIEKSSFLTSTEKETIIKVRIGQATFRKDLVDEFKGRCILSGINVPELLIASHIKPWDVSKNEERIDKDNGLLLSSSIDKLFDKHLISFDDNGFMLISKRFKNKYHNYEEIMKKIGIYEKFISGEKSINFNEKRKKYLKIHRNKTKILDKKNHQLSKLI